MKYWLMILSCLMFCTASAQISPQFIHALNMVEASGQINNVKAGDHGHAIGGLQIHYKYWQDSGTLGKYEECKDFKYSTLVVNNYLNKYAAKYISNNDYEALARIHNGGPNGLNKRSTIAYWNRVNYYLSGLPKTPPVSP